MSSAIDWKNIGFSYIPTKAFVYSEFKNGSWGPLTLSEQPYFPLHIAAACLHYGSACFEGLKAFSQKDGGVAVFRPEENADRLISTGRRLVMEPPPKELFLDAVRMVIKTNREFVPPYGTGASMYLRPLLVGTTPRIGIQPSDDFLFAILATPVGPYYKDGFSPVKALVQEKYDRAAPHGVGNVKASGNYAAGLLGDLEGKKKGYPICLYLDSAKHECIDEFGTSNFIGITKKGVYVTPDSASILKSITNKSLRDLAKDFGMPVEQRKIDFSELDQFAEVGACGTAAVITPINSVTRGETTITFGRPDKAGETLERLFKHLQAIQYGEVEDTHEWMFKI